MAIRSRTSTHTKKVWNILWFPQGKFVGASKQIMKVPGYKTLKKKTRKE
jgi:hypothetical protein